MAKAPKTTADRMEELLTRRAELLIQTDAVIDQLGTLWRQLLGVQGQAAELARSLPADRREWLSDPHALQFLQGRIGEAGIGRAPMTRYASDGHALPQKRCIELGECHEVLIRELKEVANV